MSKLEFSEQERKIAESQVEKASDKMLRPAFVTSMAPHWCEVAINLQCCLNRAEKLIGRLLGEVCGPFADTTVVPESEAFLTALREERGEQ